MALDGCPMIRRQNLPASGSRRRPASSSTTGRSLMTRSAWYRASSAQPLPEPPMTSADVQIAAAIPAHAAYVSYTTLWTWPMEAPNRRKETDRPEWKVGVEYDGEQHWTDPNRHAEDIERLEYLAAQGWIIVRVAHGSCDTTARKSSRTSDARSFSTCRSPGRTSCRAGLPRPSAAGAAAGRSAAP
jgi:hypothetical protein